MYINVLNGDGISKVLICNVLYSPSMGVTLILISRITDSKSSVLFHSDLCCIYNNLHMLLGQVPKQNGLYWTFPPYSEFAAWAVEMLTIDELHRQLGYEGHEVVRKLVEKGLVQGVELDLESKPLFCISCEWEKEHWKPIQKIREDEWAVAVGNKIHLDLWGLSPVETINWKGFFISFTNDHSYSILFSLPHSPVGVHHTGPDSTGLHQTNWTHPNLCLNCNESSWVHWTEPDFC